MSLRSFQRRQKIMLLLKMAGENMAKNNTWSPLSAVVSMMGGLMCPPLPSSVGSLLSCGAVLMQAAESGEQEALGGICIAALLPRRACHFISF